MFKPSLRSFYKLKFASGMGAQSFGKFLGFCEVSTACLWNTHPLPRGSYSCCGLAGDLHQGLKSSARVCKQGLGL
jgi:hypothetical protein